MPRVDTRYPTTRDRHERQTRDALTAEYSRQRDVILARLDAGATTLLPAVHDDELAHVISDRAAATATDIAALVATSFDNDDYDPSIMDEWLAAVTSGIAEAINIQTRERLDGADAERAAEVTDNLLDGGVRRHALSIVTTVGNFAARDAAAKSGAVSKRWQVNSGNPRSAHHSVSGETVPIDGTFSNGLRFPGDGPAAQTANCRCSLTVMS